MFFKNFKRVCQPNPDQPKPTGLPFQIMSTSNNPDLLMTKLNTKFAAWINTQLKTNPSADWSVAALEYTCHVENIAAAFKVVRSYYFCIVSTIYFKYFIIIIYTNQSQILHMNELFHGIFFSSIFLLPYFCLLGGSTCL